jgi:hypothetical protein
MRNVAFHSITSSARIRSDGGILNNERALRIAEELEAAGWHESAGQVRKATETAWRFQSYARP